MTHCSQTWSFVSSQSHALKLPKPTSLQTHNPKSFILAGKFHFLSKSPPPTPPLSLQLSCHGNGALISSPERDIENPISSTDYLIDSLGLPPEAAVKFTTQFTLKSTARADAVLALFRSYGFTTTHMVTIFSTFPKLLSSKPSETLKPKIDFLVQNGISGDLLFHVLTSDPHILRISLHRKIVPCFQFLHRFYRSRDISDGVATLFSLRRGTWILRTFGDTTEPNVKTLLRYGVPKPHIVKLFPTASYLSLPAKQFSKTVRKVKEMGFDPSSAAFVRAVRTFLIIGKEKRNAKKAVFKSYGWTEENVRVLFGKHPLYLTVSVEKLKESLEFFMTEHHWSVDDFIKYAPLVNYNMEKRILPRFCVLEILYSRGLVKKTTFGGAFMASEDKFLERFVKKYEQQVPRLLEVYKKNLVS